MVSNTTVKVVRVLRLALLQFEQVIQSAGQRVSQRVCLVCGRNPHTCQHRTHVLPVLIVPPCRPPSPSLLQTSDALANMQTWDGKGETHLTRNFCLTGHLASGDHHTKENPQNMPLNDLWGVGVRYAAKVADAIVSACRREANR